jgi:hypothetical protein
VIAIQFLLVEPLFKLSEFRAESSIGCQNDIVVAEVVPSGLLRLTMEQMRAKPMPGFDFCANLLLPLADKSNRTDDQCSLYKLAGMTLETSGAIPFVHDLSVVESR